MVVQVHKVGDEFTAVIPPHVAAELGLVDGSPLEISPVITPTAGTIRYATVEEAMQAYKDTLPYHEAAYRALAK